MYPSSSLLISTYNWPEALSVCLKSVLRQNIQPDEVIIADDGSDKRTEEVIAAFKLKSIVPVKHIWHEDKGFRLATIRNKAIAAAVGEYIIQVDGDMILNNFFVEDHLRFAKRNSVVRASRTYINKELSDRILKEQNLNFGFLNPNITNKLSAVRIPYLWSLFETSYKNTGAELYEIHGCNMAFWRSDAIEANGYNESFVGWGPEDKEFLVRLLNGGVRKRFLKLGAVAYHIYHSENLKTALHANEKEFQEAINSNSTFARLGMDQYL